MESSLAREEAANPKPFWSFLAVHAKNVETPVSGEMKRGQLVALVRKTMSPSFPIPFVPQFGRWSHVAWVQIQTPLLTLILPPCCSFLKCKVEIMIALSPRVAVRSK